MRFLPILPLLLLAPGLAQAGERCAHSAPRQLQLDLAGVKTLRLETGPHTVRVQAAPGAAHALRGRACASRADWLPELTVTQEKRDGTLVVRVRREKQSALSGLLGETYAYLDLAGTVPDHVLVQLVVGSGDVHASGAAALSADVGSGDVHVRGVRGPVTAKVGSGDLEIDGAGSLKVLSIGSGDVQARSIGGAVEVGSIGSGDFVLQGARGDVRIGSIGSGDAGLEDVAGAVRVGSIGSGEVEVAGAAALAVDAIGSGDVSHRGVTGPVELPRKN